MTEASPRGTYLVIAEALRHGIDGGRHGSGLPSEAGLMREHGVAVARNTIRRALKTLEAEGVLESAPGIGWRMSQGGDRRPLVERMVAVIEDDSLAAGDAYPSEARLCERFGVSRTARTAGLAHMEETGLLATIHGKGRAVRALPSPTVGP
ncbi:GntR family transcriptional regulator [Streptomyces bacillaris]|uniref:GntR family transcriptional regulator n=1 Tax=Streptomyces bacillaris TaxID=68179 RepID=UPI00364D18AC